MTSRAEKYLGFDDKWLIIGGIPFITVAVTIMLFGVEGLFDFEHACFPIGILFTTSYWFVFRELVIHYHKRFPSYDFTKSRFLYVTTRMFIGYFGVKIIIGSLVHYFFPSTTEIYEHHQVSADVTTIILIMLVFFIYEGIYYFNRSRLIEIEKNHLERITAEQRLDTLKNQVNPHFLFNSLNTLVTMIPEEPETAITFVEQLSKTYRNILEFRDEKLIPIRQELKAMESYIYLLKTRFRGKIHIYNTIDEDVMNEFVLPISLQILIENAVKHNITSSSKPLKIELYSEDMFLVVRNNLQKKSQKYNSTKLGLANIQSRYKLLTNQAIEVIESPEYFTVRLPIIKNQPHANPVD